jgi:UPF0176 protein
VELQKIILYYGFAPVADPETLKLWQKTLCESLGLKGRVIISKHGINGTLGGDMSALKKYVRATKEYPGFKKIDFKWSEGTGNDFPRLRVRVRPELVAFNAPDEVKVDLKGVVGGGVHLKPAQVDQLVAERGDEVVFFDGRNAFEAKIGKFKNAIIPDVQTSHDFIRDIESGKYDNIKDLLHRRCALRDFERNHDRPWIQRGLPNRRRNRSLWREPRRQEPVGRLALCLRRSHDHQLHRRGEDHR